MDHDQIICLKSSEADNWQVHASASPTGGDVWKYKDNRTCM